MYNEIQELGELIARLKADIERLQQGQAGPSVLPSTSSA